MVKCPRGTPEQKSKNLAYFNTLRAKTYITEDVCKSESEELRCPEEKDYLSTTEFDSIRADKRNPPSTEDEITYLFVNHFLDILLKCWDGTPCVKPKFTPPEEASKSEEGETSDREKIFEDKQSFNATEEYLSNLYKTSSKKLFQDNKQERASMEETLSAICRERCESRKSSMTSQQEIDEDEEGFALSWTFPIPDEDVYMNFQNGAWYKGRVSRRLMDGDGTFFWEDGASFQGEFIAGTATGFGRLEFPDLSVFEGGVYKGFRHGEGLHCMHDSPVMYSGEWWLGKKNGHGIIFYSDPKCGLNYYKGSWVNGMQEGFGYRQYQSGSKYLGHWKNGKRDGSGIMFWWNNDIYRGEWKDGLMEGFGEYMWNGFVNKTFSAARVNTYRGYWANGKRNGFGLLELSNGSTIKTIWVNDEKNGPGAVVCPNGAVIISNRKLFGKDKPALLNESEENLLGKLFRNHGVQANRRKNAKKETAEIPDQSQLLAYMSSMEKAKTISIPIHTPVHSLDLNCHTRRFKEQKNEILQKQKEHVSIFGLNNTPRMESFSDTKTLNPNDVNEFEEMFSSEEKLLRYCIMVNLTRLKDCYEHWSTVACSTKPPFHCTLIRLFFWEMLTVADVPMRSFSLIDIDNLLASEPTFLVDSPHDPFEKIQLWQFIHYLIMLSWHIYGRYVLEENKSLGRVEVEDFLEEFHNQNEKAIIPSAFSYFLQNHIFAQRKRAGNAVKNWDLLPMGAMYLAYKSVGEPHSAKQFLAYIYQNKEPESRTTLPNIAKVPQLTKIGKNAIPITNEVSYLTSEEPFNQPEINLLLNEGNESVSKGSCFGNLGAEEIVRGLIYACPSIMEDYFIVDMEYQLTFLEYYKALTECAEISLKKKTLKKIQSEILTNYKRELEEYDRKMKEYERQKESTTALAKKTSQIKRSKK